MIGLERNSGKTFLLIRPFFALFESNYRIIGLLLAALPTCSIVAQTEQFWTTARLRMVHEEVENAGVHDARVLTALRETRRHLFVPPAQRKNAYLDMALPIGEGQTISPPFVVAYMTQAIEPRSTDKVLEIGTGSGYQAAVLSPLVAKVYSIEIVESLGQKAAQTLQKLKYDNVHTKVGDGFQGWAEYAPFDKIIVTCSPEKIPPALVEQLQEGGQMVIPLGERYQQTLYRFTKQNGMLKTEPLEPTFFVPMTGRAEELREKKDDPSIPNLLNGGFETTDEKGNLVGWYYLRQGEVLATGANEGQRYLQFHNNTPGRGAQILQAIGTDGRQIKSLRITLSIRASSFSGKQMPPLELNFFDEQRGPAGVQYAGPWPATAAWSKKEARIDVPVKARLAVLAVGLFGGTGELAVDDINLEVTERR